MWVSFFTVSLTLCDKICYLLSNKCGLIETQQQPFDKALFLISILQSCLMATNSMTRTVHTSVDVSHLVCVEYDR